MVAELDADLRDAGPITVVAWPDVAIRDAEAVELLASDGREGVVAVEHTVIESYGNQLRASAVRMAMFPLGGIELPDVPDAGHFRLLLDVDALPGLGRRERELLPSMAETWVRSMLPLVPWPHVSGLPTFIDGSAEEVSVRMSLERWTDSVELVGPLARVVRIGWWRPVHLEHLRLVRLADALRAKVPKLLRAHPNARTILVLEDRDMYMSAPAFVSHGMQVAAGDYDLPDVIYLLNVTVGNPVLTPIYADDRWWHELEHGRGWLKFPTIRAAEFNSMPL